MASYLTLEELGQFRQVCKAFYTLGSNASLLQPHYNRVKALDPSLPALLPTDISPALAFKQAFEKVRDAQKLEASKLTYYLQHYSTTVPEKSPTTLQQLEQRSSTLDTINSLIIKDTIHSRGLNYTELSLKHCGITRLPVSLINEPNLIPFWQKLTKLDCSNNAISTLNLKDCTELKELYCSNNKISTLKLQGCLALDNLDCPDNELITLELTDLSNLVQLNCAGNKLINVNLQGLANLRYAYLYQNPISILNLKGCSALDYVDYKRDLSTLTELNLEGTSEKIKNTFTPIIEALRVQKLAHATLNPGPNFLPTFNNSAAPLPPQGIKRPAEENSEEEKFETQDSDSKPKRQKP